jgi:hypothetical protein
LGIGTPPSIWEIILYAEPHPFISLTDNVFQERQQIMDNPFQLNPDESMLYRSRPSRQWTMLVWRIGIGILEVLIFLLLSFLSFTSIGTAILGTFLPPSFSIGISRVIFQGIIPILIIAWFAEDTARIFTSEFILTSQRIWIKGSPYAWTSEKETPLSDVQSISTRRDAVFIHLKNTKKAQVHMFPNGKQLVEAYTQFTQKTGTA